MRMAKWLWNSEWKKALVSWTSEELGKQEY